MKDLRAFMKASWERRGLIKAMVIRDFRSRYVGSVFGLAWAILQPLAMMGTLYLVFAYGLKVKIYDETSFISWFFSAIIAWNFFQEVMLSTTGVYREYSYLIKKMNFQLELLPLVKILSGLIIHSIFIVIVLGIVTINSGFPGWYAFQLIYYIIALVYLMFGLGWITSTFNVLLKDVGQLVSIFIQFGFWATPIIWPLKSLPENLQLVAKLNPLYYIIEGYRKSLVYKIPLWQESFYHTAYFWALSTLIFILGIYSFRRLKPHFADVL